MPILLLLLTTFAFGESFEIRALREKTFTRDNTYCQMDKKRVEIQIRSDSSNTENKKDRYGEYIFFYPLTEGELLSVNEDKLHNYRFFSGENTLCSKSRGYLIDKDRLAVLFLKENRPFRDKLSFQVFDIKNARPMNVIDTDFTVDSAELFPDGFLFRTYAERVEQDMGHITINNSKFFFQDRDFSIWMKYTGAKGFEISPAESFQKFSWIKHFKDEKDFLAASGWDPVEKKFKNSVLYVAVNHKENKECVLLSPIKIKMTGNENWRCL